MRSLLCASRNNDLLRFEFLSSHLAGFRPAGSHCEKSGKSDDTCASARSGCAKQRSLLCPLSERRWRHPLLFAVLDLLVLLDQVKSTRKTEKGKTSRSILREESRVFDGASAARSSSRFFAMRSCCALRATMIICWCLFLAVLWPARMHCFRYFRSAIPQTRGLLKYN